MGCCSYFRLLATAIFVTGVLPLLTVRGASKYVSTWHFIGPFSVGKTEIDGDPLYGYFDHGALGGEIQVGNNSQLVERQVMSEHVSGGQVYWSKIRGKGGYASLAPQTYDAKVQVDLNSIVQSTSSITIQESQGWLYGYLKGGTKDFNKSFRLHCQGLHTVWVGNTYYHGDIYSGNKMFINFVWETGKKRYKVVARIRYKGVLPRFSCKLSKLKSRAQIFPPLRELTPDVVDGVLVSPLIPLTISNDGTGWLNDFEMRPRQGNSNIELRLNEEEESILKLSKGIAPTQSIVIPMRLSLLSKPENIVKGIVGPSGEREHCIQVHIDLVSRSGNVIDTTSFFLRCRHGLQSHTFTFRSHDGSISSASLIRPRKRCSLKKKCGVLISLSGVGVSPSSQADAHKYQDNRRRAKKGASSLSGSEWTFGMKNAWILCPGRQGAHNFEGKIFDFCKSREAK